jgi:hypothetical protein
VAKRKMVPVEPTPAPVAEQVTKATFRENEDDTVTASFVNGNVEKPFEITLQNMTWGLMEDIDAIQQQRDSDDNPPLSLILDFFREYVFGGPRAVPLKHTRTVFEAITGYMSHTFGEAAEKN